LVTEVTAYPRGKRMEKLTVWKTRFQRENFLRFFYRAVTKVLNYI
jgi:hypothetical protein